MNSYLVTPRFVLGADSFHVQANCTEEAIAAARERIKREDWSSPDGWDLLLEVTTFEDHTGEPYLGIR